MNRRLLLLALLTLTGCGSSGSPGGGGSQGPVTVTVPSTFARDGYIRSDGMAFTTANSLVLGDQEALAPGLLVHAVVGFDLGGNGIPAGATIQTATLALQQKSLAGSPYTDLGNVLVDHVNLGPFIDLADFSGNTLLSAIGVLSTDTLLTVKSLEVGAQVQADLTAGRTTSDFRLRFSTDNDSDGLIDHAVFIDGENTLNDGQPPLLTVTYVP